jgi:7-carboxy-7-deazaguanine synthase
VLVNEMFAPTVQGEGINTGKVVGFIRLANCNLACSWCDTPYSWDWKRYDKAAETTEMDIESVAQVVQSWNVPRVIITGGEPLMQQEDIVKLIALCADVKFDIETNGTITPLLTLANSVDTFNVSPKLSHSGDIRKKRIKDAPLMHFANLAQDGKAQFKFVCETVADLDEVDLIAQDYDIPNSAIWIMPEGTDAPTLVFRLEKLADAVVARRYNLTTRLHVLAWGHRRAV